MLYRIFANLYYSFVNFIISFNKASIEFLNEYNGLDRTVNDDLNRDIDDLDKLIDDNDSDNLDQVIDDSNDDDSNDDEDYTPSDDSSSD